MGPPTREEGWTVALKPLYPYVLRIGVSNQRFLTAIRTRDQCTHPTVESNSKDLTAEINIARVTYAIVNSRWGGFFKTVQGHASLSLWNRCNFWNTTYRFRASRNTAGFPTPGFTRLTSEQLWMRSSLDLLALRSDVLHWYRVVSSTPPTNAQRAVLGSWRGDLPLDRVNFKWFHIQAKVGRNERFLGISPVDPERWCHHFYRYRLNAKKGWKPPSQCGDSGE